MTVNNSPEITVAAVAERSGRFLTIEERVRGKLVLNQPAGHLENNETLSEAVARECFEESGWRFEPDALCGIYTWQHPYKDVTVVRFAFCGTAHSFDAGASLDEGIVRALWLSPDELGKQSDRLRSPMVMQAVHDFKAGRRFPLDMLTSVFNSGVPNVPVEISG